ncbi:MAG: sarcosine oxidase subunit alpha family protein [Sheuella sp.]|nr:sarcosine oxidase subunit alpha family protein [Sheuella sp.]
MMREQPNRLQQGGRINRDVPVRFTFDGKPYHGYAGDTLASALLANGVKLIGRSFKYHRRRGIYSAGPEEPNALVQLRTGARTEPNTRATMAEIFEGLQASSQNRWPTLAFDWRAINQKFSALMPAGFYYKTFMWPAKFWMFYEKQIRRAAGLGRAPVESDPDRYAFEYAHCDILIVGSGPAGLSAALAAAKTGQTVVLADERAELGGSALWERNQINNMPASLWAEQSLIELSGYPNVRLLKRSTVSGCYDHGMVTIVERVADHLDQPPEYTPRQRLIHLRTQRIILATGSIERPLVFSDNDKPGVMLASGVRTYINLYAVLPGKHIVVFTNNDDAYRTAFDAIGSGAESVTVVDTRAKIHPELLTRSKNLGITCISHSIVTKVHGANVTSISILNRNGTGAQDLVCDVLAHSGGWNPTVHLLSQSGGKLKFDESLTTFVPDSIPSHMTIVGAANGAFTLKAALTQGNAAGRGASDHEEPQCEAEDLPTIEALWQIPKEASRGKRFVDIQDDVTVEDIELAHRENFRSVEHLKRYTTLGMGTDQGKTSNVNGLAIMATLRGEPIPGVGTTTFRPPYTPVALGLFAGAETGKHQTPIRRTALHDWHLEQQAPMTTVGHWLRPKTYLRTGETYDAAWRRENIAVRESVGLVDVGTLGKIDIQGPDAHTFIQRIYSNNFVNLAVGKLRYGLMLREDGIVMDDGTVARFAEDHFVISTTTANAGKVLSYLEWLLQVAWPELRCHAVSVTEQFAQFALAGPKSREVLSRLLPDCDVSDSALPHLGIMRTQIQGTELIVMRMSYSGERAYELAIGADFGVDLWTSLMRCGADLGITPYGTEAMGVLRIEKGHVAGSELDGRTTPADLGLAKLARNNGGYIGAHLLQREALEDPRRPCLVGLIPVDGQTPIRAGSQLVATEVQARAEGVVAKQGFVSCATPSAFLGHPIALGFIENGTNRHGQEVIAASPLSNEYVRVRIVHPVFVDPENTRLKG